MTSRISVLVLTTVWVALVPSGCRAPASQSSRFGSSRGVATNRVSAERSVKPGINDSYDDPDVEKWLERFEGESREIYRSRREIVHALGLAPGSVVADVGSGTGFFTLLFSDAVGSSGKVVAVDIVPEFLELTRRRAREEGLYNIQTVLCDEDSVRLPPNSMDVVFVCDVYHHFEYPRSSLRSVHRALKPGGEFVVIDFERIEGESRGWIMNHVRAGQGVVRREIEDAGFEFVERVSADYLDENYYLRFRKAR